jgi:hypothetical protein
MRFLKVSVTEGGYGFFPGGDPRKFSPDSEEGLTLAALARAFKATWQTVTQAIIDAGGTVRSKGARGVPS